MKESMGQKNILELLWSYRTTTRTVIEETLFFLTYTTKAIILVKIGLLSYRVSVENLEGSEEGLAMNLDILEEKDKIVRSGWLLTNKEWPITTIARLTPDSSNKVTWYLNEQHNQL